MTEQTGRQAKRMSVTDETFNIHQYERLLEELATSTAKASNTLLTYGHFVEYFSNLSDISVDDLLLAIHVAYSWMPTMVNLFHISDLSELETLIPSIRALRELKTFRDLDAKERNALGDLIKLSRVINNSVVGTSKVLHFFAPQTIPIIDSRVVIAWNRFFKDCPTVILSGCQPVVVPTKFLDYWKAMLFWKERVGLSSVRQLENAFFILGGGNQQEMDRPRSS